MKPGRWQTATGEATPERAELMRLAREGERWEEIGAVFYPHLVSGGHSCSNVFTLFATADDRQARRAALKARNFNKSEPYKNRGGYLSAPGVQRERVDPWAGMGECFA